jgi:hypothetical protein
MPVLEGSADSSRDDYDRVMAINLRGMWSCMKFELQAQEFLFRRLTPNAKHSQ